MTGSALELRGVTKRFGDFVAVDDLSLTVPQGSFFALLGASGCGKTTLLRVIAGFEDAHAGEVRIGERVVASGRQGLPPERRRVAVKDKAEEAAMARLLDALVGKEASAATRESFRQRFRDGHLDATEIEIEVDGVVHAERLAFWPFTHEELDADLRAAGWSPEASTWAPDVDRYLVTARASGA